jgi:copper oxidase (laccase) domain-containing protein
MSRTATTNPRADFTSSPIYRALQDVPEVGAAFTGRGTAPHNRHFSFHRPAAADPTNISKHFRANLQCLASHEGFDPGRVTLPNGAWPHSGQAIKAEDYKWVTNCITETIMPVTHTGVPVTYDAVATRSDKYVLGAQGADCPAVFLCDPRSQVIGLAHAGWKPIVRGVIRNIVDAMVELGARPQDIVAYISPGVGDRYNTFKWDYAMEPYVREVFVEAGRCDLLQDRTIRHEMNSEDLAGLRAALGRDIHDGTSLKLSSLAVTELCRRGLSASNISCNLESSIVDQYPGAEQAHPTPFKYHSYRREHPNHGLSMSVLFLKSNVPPAV